MITHETLTTAYTNKTQNHTQKTHKHNKCIHNHLNQTPISPTEDDSINGGASKCHLLKIPYIRTFHISLFVILNELSRKERDSFMKKNTFSSINSIIFFFFRLNLEMESAPRNVQVRPLSSSMMMITWEPPETPNGQVTVSIL